MTQTEGAAAEVAALYEDYAAGGIGRRDFMARAAALGVGAAAMSAIDLLSASPAAAQVAEAARAAQGAAALDLAEWSYFWLGVKRAKLARGTVVSGEQMYVEYWVPRQVKHPYPIVIVHGGGGQGLDWLGTPDGRPGWVTYLVQAGWKVYLVDRPGHGRSPYAPELQGPWPAHAATYAAVQHQFTAPEKATDPYGPQAKLHTQWPGAGVLGDPTVDQVIAGQGGSFLPSLAVTHAIWAERGAELLDKIGPAVVMAHSMGGPSLWIYANARPRLVKGLVGVEPGGPPFGQFRWGLTASPMAYDPPVKDPSALKTVEVPARDGRSAGRLQAEPARKLKNLQKIPIAVITSPASYHWAYDLHSVAFLRQAGCSVDHIELEKIGITGNAHFMMMEKNNRAVLQPIMDWLEAKVSQPARKARVRPRAGRSPDPTAMRLSEHGFFWVGLEPRTMPYGTIPRGQMYVQYLIPAEVRHAYPVVLVHGGSGQMLHYMGTGDGVAGWAHYYVQAGYKVYLVDRVGHGRSVYHPDALGPSNLIPTYELIQPDIARGKRGGRWTGTGEIGDPLLDQLMASQNPTPQDNALAMAMWRKGGAALLDRIGPAIIQTHSAGGPFGWVVADERPKLTKAIVSFEGAGAPLIQMPPPGAVPSRGEPALSAMALPNLAGIPVAYYTAANSGRTQGPAIVEALKASGARAEHIPLADRGIAGNGHFAMLETNRRQVFELIRGWVDKVV
jgi:pimeloyl-ACP methyl ester carboxylesterase